MAKPQSLAGSEDPRWVPFIEAITRRFRTGAGNAGGVVRRAFRIGNQAFRLEFAGPALLEGMTRALEHHPTLADEESADVTVLLWDSVSTRTSMPPPPWSHGSYAWRSEVSDFNVGSWRLAYHPGSGILNIFDTRRRRAYFWIRDAGELPFYESGAPLLALFNWALNSRGIQVVHAAAVGGPAGAVLLVGKGGSGKSTTALACAFLSGMSYAGDDYCLVAPGPPPRVLSLYNTAKIELDRLRDSFPHLAPATGNAERFAEEKPLLFLHRLFPGSIAEEMPLRAVLIPRFKGRAETSLAPARAMEGLRALAPSTLFQLAGAAEAELRLMSDLVRRVPCHLLDLGTGLDTIAPVIRRLLESGNRVN